jgi:hypothetical protein
MGDPKPAGITGSAGSDNIFNTLPSPLLLPDGRWRHQFPAELIPGYMSDRAFELCIRARACGVVLVADGPTLIVVEPWLSELEPETLVGLRDCAGEIIAQLRGEHRARPA